MSTPAEIPKPDSDAYAEFEGWEQEMFRHRPVVSMEDGRIAGCQCLDRVFVKDREDWGTHLALVITSRLALSAHPAEEREAQGWAEAEAYADDSDPSKRIETMDDFMTGWRTALRALSAHPAEETWEYAMTTDYGGLSDFTLDLAEAQEKVRAWNERAAKWRREAQGRASYPGAYVLRRRAGIGPGPWGPLSKSVIQEQEPPA